MPRRRVVRPRDPRAGDRDRAMTSGQATFGDLLSLASSELAGARAPADTVTPGRDAAEVCRRHPARGERAGPLHSRPDEDDRPAARPATGRGKRMGPSGHTGT